MHKQEQNKDLVLDDLPAVVETERQKVSEAEKDGDAHGDADGAVQDCQHHALDRHWHEVAVTCVVCV